MFKESFALDQQPDFPKAASSSATMLEIYLENRSLVGAHNGTKPAFLGSDLLQLRTCISAYGRPCTLLSSPKRHKPLPDPAVQGAIITQNKMTVSVLLHPTPFCLPGSGIAKCRWCIVAKRDDVLLTLFRYELQQCCYFVFLSFQRPIAGITLNVSLL